MTQLTRENAKTAKLIRNINNPSWGVKKFNYRENDMCFFGRGSDSAMLFEGEYKFWEVIE